MTPQDPTADAIDAAERLAAIVDSSFDAIVSKDLDSIIQSWNAAAERLFGYTAEETIGNSVLMLIPPHLHGEEADIIARIRAGERVGTYETIRRHKSGALIEVSLTISPVRNRKGEIVGASKIARDITSAKDSERRIRSLMREVNHRTKNQFAVILSMIRETKRRSVDPDEFEERVRGRIMAMSRSHDLLVSADWAGTSLLDLAMQHVSPEGREQQVMLSGPEMILDPSAVQNIGMALHELAANSGRFGVLAGDGGRVAVSWRVVPSQETGDQFELVWDETSADSQTTEDEATLRRGFGTVVLERVAPSSVGGTATLERDSGHLRWTLTAPLANAVIRVGDQSTAATPVIE